MYVCYPTPMKFLQFMLTFWAWTTGWDWELRNLVPVPHAVVRGVLYHRFWLCAMHGTRILQAIQAKKGMILQRCLACGHIGNIDMRHKLTTFILKNPPEQVGLHVACIQLLVCASLVYTNIIVTCYAASFVKSSSYHFRFYNLFIYFLYFLYLFKKNCFLLIFLYNKLIMFFMIKSE